MAYGVTESVLAMRGDREAAANPGGAVRDAVRLAFRALGLAAEGRLDEAWPRSRWRC